MAKITILNLKLKEKKSALHFSFKNILMQMKRIETSNLPLIYNQDKNKNQGLKYSLV
jgi:hypothetical protein